MSIDFHESTAIFGGSFHPPHIGHLQAIQGLLKNPGVRRIMVLPSYGTPLKKVSVAFEQRMEMAKLAFQQLPSVEISDFENKNQTQYTWQVLEKLVPQVKNPVFVIGTDQFLNLEKWSKFPEFLGMCDWIVLLRKPSSLASIQPAIRNLVQTQLLKPAGSDREFSVMGKKMLFVETEAMEVSSTWLREKISLNEWGSVQSLIPNPVKDYILRNHIYGK